MARIVTVRTGASYVPKGLILRNSVLEKRVPTRIQGRAGAGANGNFLVDSSDVILDCARGDVESRADLSIGTVAGQERQNLDFVRAQFVG